MRLGRLDSAELGRLDDTLLYYIVGDNGASAEGQLNGTFNEMLTFNGMAAQETPEFMTSKIAAFGGPEAYNHYAVGWAHAMDTPYQWTKQVASHWGGTRNGLVVHWPAGIDAEGETRDQFHHLIDVAPTVLDAARLPEIDPAGKLAHDHQVEAADQLALQAGGVGERVKDHRRAQISEQLHLLAQPQNAALGAQLERQRIPLRSANRAKQHGIAGDRLGQGPVGQRDTRLVEGSPTDETFADVEADDKRPAPAASPQ